MPKNLENFFSDADLQKSISYFCSTPQKTDSNFACRYTLPSIYKRKKLDNFLDCRGFPVRVGRNGYRI